ncbi:MAG: DUF177 domain-containing protein [Acholeplasma sp.]|nr:DUF177 domain-containing protein [Acholeplasma sp.]
MIIHTALIDDIKNINEDIDLNHYADKEYDILAINKCHIEGTLRMLHNELYVDLKVNTNLVLASTRTLKPINYDLDFDLNVLFGDSKDADYALIDDINLGEIIYGHILLEKPIKIFNDDEEALEKEKVTNQAFKELKDWNK